MINSSSLIINQPNNLTGEIFIPGDKSITHRAIMLGSLSNGRLDIKNSLLSEDCKRTIDAFIKLGVDITIDDTTISIYGKGLNALKPPCSIIDAGNSGTLARLISGVLAVQNFDSSISGDSSLVKRPMKRIIDPLTVAGANISSNDNLMPLSFKQSGKLKVINYTCLIPSAQIKSCLVLASLFLDGTSIIKETIKQKIQYLTLFTFSTENWKRPKNEISFLFNLLENFLTDKIDNLIEKKVKLKFIGEIGKLPTKLKKLIKLSELKTSKNSNIQVNVALNYGSKKELINSIKTINKKKIKINERNIDKHLYTRGIVEPDILIRTGNTQRLSNFMLWQLEYTEIFFEKKLWPDFKVNDFKKILVKFKLRKRNFGSI